MRGAHLDHIRREVIALEPFVFVWVPRELARRLVLRRPAERRRRRVVRLHRVLIAVLPFLDALAASQLQAVAADRASRRRPSATANRAM